MRPILIMTCLLAIFGYNLALADDSIPARELNEITVVGDREWIENGIINILPTKSEKKLSNSPATLIKSMNLTFLREEDGNIVNMAGEKVPVFINGEEAQDIDISTFWPKEVRKVQYLEYPDGPSYKGVKAAVNFIIPRYEAGGVTKVDLYHKTPVNGYDNAASKLVYRKMTYGLMFSGDYYRNHDGTASGETTYRDIFYGGSRYETLARSEDSRSFLADEGIRCAFNAKYTGDKLLMTHTVSLGWLRNPESSTDGSDSWSSDLFGSSSSHSAERSRSLSPQIQGNYELTLSKQWYVSASWQYCFSHSNSAYSSQLGMTRPVLNSNKEDVSSANISIFPSFRLSKKWSFQLMIDGTMDWFSTLYGGSAVTTQRQSRQSAMSALRISWTPLRSLRLSLQPGLAASLWQISDVRQHTLDPAVNANITWNPIRKFTLNGSLVFNTEAASASESNPVMVKSSELLWILGNPYLKNSTSWQVSVNSSYRPSNRLSLSMGMIYARLDNQPVATYSVAPAEMGGLIQELANGDPVDHLIVNLNLRGSFLKRKLSVGIRPSFHHSQASSTRLDHLSVSGNMDYTAGNFRISLEYRGPYKGLDKSGLERSWRQDYCNAALTYGNDNIYICLKAEDIFHTRERRSRSYISPYFSSSYTRLTTGRRVSLNLTYTFAYGKKVDKDIDINGPESIKTSVLSASE